jgi:Caspase domain/Domain of unknown function (DUF4384)
MKFLTVFVTTFFVFAPGLSASAEKLALLIGVGQYQAFKGQAQGNLEGPPHDVAALQQTLVARLGFPVANVVTLVDSAATKTAIMRELNRLKERSKPGDQIFVYFSGHGTSALDSDGVMALPHNSGALIPYDYAGNNAAISAQHNSVIIGQRDIRPVIDSLEAGDRLLTIIIDACYSAQAVRSGGLPSRFLPRPDEKLIRDFQKSVTPTDREAARQAIKPFPYRNTVFLSSAAEGEQARDIPKAFLSQFPTHDGKPHGALTDALLRVLKGEINADTDADGAVSIREIHQVVNDFMTQRGYGHTPLVFPSLFEDTKSIGFRTLFSQPRIVGAQTTVVEKIRPLLVLSDNPNTPVMRAIAALPNVEVNGTEQSSRRPVRVKQTGGTTLLINASGDTLAQINAGTPEKVATAVSQYVWNDRMRQLSESLGRQSLILEFSPNSMGGNFEVGEQVDFSLRSDKDTTVLLVTVDAEGLISVLYPSNTFEAQRKPAKTLIRIDGTKVQPPYGSDVVLAIAFDQAVDLRPLMKLTSVVASNQKVELIEQLMRNNRGKFSYAFTELRTFPKR